MDDLQNVVLAIVGMGFMLTGALGFIGLQLSRIADALEPDDEDEE